MVAVSPARRAASEILRRVEEEGAFASVLLAAGDEQMRPEDRALCYELVLGVLRWQLWLDHLIEHYSAGRSAQQLDAPVRRALRLGLYQLRFLSRVPPSAVVNESVNLIHAARLRSAAGFVNAVLRRATREPEYDPAANIADPVRRLAIAASHPEWLIERWAGHFGFTEAETFARANNEAPPVAFRVAANDADSRDVLDELRAAGGTLTASRVAPGAWRIEGAGSLLRRLAREGRIYLQDEASQLVAHVLEAHSGERVLDVCAAPGSKTTHIAALTPDAALIVAGDLYEHRLRTAVEAGARQKTDAIRAVVYDAASALPFAAQWFDRVLVDAPCTGTGTLRRNPEIRWRISPSDIEELARRQRRILACAAPTVRPGGRLVYSTCSVEPEENEAVVENFLKENAAFVPTQTVALTPLQTTSGRMRIWPHKEGADGFFITVMMRKN